MLSLIVLKLKRHLLARVKFPDVEKMESFAHQINQHEPKANDVIGFMDGHAHTSECTSEPVKQNTMYILTLWLTISLCMVWAVKYFFVQSTSPVAGMMDPLLPIFYHAFK
jgi:hypothetical protein